MSPTLLGLANVSAQFVTLNYCQVAQHDVNCCDIYDGISYSYFVKSYFISYILNYYIYMCVCNYINIFAIQTSILYILLNFINLISVI